MWVIKNIGSISAIIDLVKKLIEAVKAPKA